MTHSFDREYWDQVWQGERATSMSTSEPNPHLVHEVSGLAPGTAIDAGCGAGAEAIWLATHGWQVTAADVLLVIEIAYSSLSYDLGYKADLYLRAKIPEYWVVDVRHQCLRVFTLAGERYETRTVREGKASPQALPGVEVDVGALFGGA